jgi:dolichol-phosphate mannosyltransferase
MILSVIIPCYNEELVIEETYRRLIAVMKDLKMQYEFIFINDGSIDRTMEILGAIAKKNKSVKVINLSRNFGHQRAVTAGINNCRGDLAVIIDSDLQDPPEVIAEMFEIMKREKANVVYGSLTVYQMLNSLLIQEISVLLTER